MIWAMNIPSGPARGFGEKRLGHAYRADEHAGSIASSCLAEFRKNEESNSSSYPGFARL